MKIGSDPADDIGARAGRARGDRRRGTLLVDANGAYARKQALLIAERARRSASSGSRSRSRATT